MQQADRLKIWEEFKLNSLVANSIAAHNIPETKTSSSLLDLHRKQASTIHDDTPKFDLGETLTRHIRKGMQTYDKVAYKYAQTHSDESLKKLNEIDQEMKDILG